MIGFIINPCSGNGKGKVVWEQVSSELQQKQIPHISCITSRPGETTALAVQLIQEHGATIIVAVGGDGTVHEAANGLWQAAKQGFPCQFGHIPAGTGNDFARAHGIPTKPLEALALALSGYAGKAEPSQPSNSVTKAVDLLRLQERVAVNSVGAGFDGMVARLANQTRFKKLLNRVGLGKLAYFVTMFRVFWTYKPCYIELTIDGQTHELAHTWLAASTNIPFYGGSMRICPHAIANDGSADVMVIRSKSRFRLLPIMFAVYAGKHIDHPAVSFYRGKSIAIRSEVPIPVQADGEPAEFTPISIEVNPQALHVICK